VTDDQTLRQSVTLYFVRHGETDWNVAKRYQGQTDTPLNDRGRAQAERNGRVLVEQLGAAALTRAHWVSSPLVRASETLEIMRRAAGLAAEATATDPRLMEIHFGHWEGRTWDELPTLDPEGFAARRADTWHWLPTGGENYVMVEQRVRAWLATLDRDTICVSHGGISRAVRGIVLGLAKTETPFLEVPQDRILILRSGAPMRWL
jgi:probable phosphoglycerate mutase